MRNLYIGLVIAVVLVISCVSGREISIMESEKAPWFCHGIDCPRFNVTYSEESNGYEERVYGSGFWARTVVSGVDFKEAQSTGFMRLFKYISGDNEDKVKIDMTSPVTNYIRASQGPFCTSSFEVSFFVPFKYQGGESVPKPSSVNVVIEKAQAMKVGVYQYSGFVRDFDKNVAPNAQKLFEKLEERGLQYDKKNAPFYVAQYDSPFRIVGRHNEIWVQILN